MLSRHGMLSGRFHKSDPCLPVTQQTAGSNPVASAGFCLPGRIFGCRTPLTTPAKTQRGKKDALRIFCIPALKVPLVAVIRRGPSAWSHLGVWDIRQSRYTPGAWTRAHLYPQRCDLSPDGRWLSYLALKGAAKWTIGQTYVAISRVPWLAVLCAWAAGGTWTRGIHFVQDTEVWEVEDPDGGDAAPCRKRFGLAVTRPAAFAVERRRGWSESPESPPRDPSDIWDERRAGELTMEKVRPRSNDQTRLTVHGDFAAFRSGQGSDTVYHIAQNGTAHWLEDVQWADWDAEGRLLVATIDGKLQIRELSDHHTLVRSEVDLGPVRPEPLPPPVEAHSW